MMVYPARKNISEFSELVQHGSRTAVLKYENTISRRADYFRRVVPDTTCSNPHAFAA
jgi:hypothetical protein